MIHHLPFMHYLINGGVELSLRTFELVSNDVCIVSSWGNQLLFFSSGRDDLSEFWTLNSLLLI